MALTELKIVTPPATELSLSMVKSFLRIDFSDDDTILSTLIQSSRERAEQYCNRSFITQTLESGLNDYSGNKLPLVGTSVTYTATTSTNRGFGYDANFSSSSTAVCSSYPSCSSLTGLTVFFNINFVALNTIIAGITGAWTISVNSGGNIVFTIKQTGVITRTVTSVTALTTSTWHTIGCVWDGTNIYIYIDGILDSTHDGAITLAAGSGGLQIGVSSLQALVNMFEVRNTALNAAQISALNYSPGGVLFNVDIHNFAVGDLIGDIGLTNTGVVTWVVDQSNFYGYPFLASSFLGISRYGNIYNTARQAIMEISNDCDGNGTSQLSIKYPIASFSDYNSPSKTTKVDVSGIQAQAFLYQDGNQASGKVLTSDASGNATWQTIVSGGTVTSVALNEGSTTTIFTISGSPITGAGTLVFTLKTQTANTVFAGPASGGSAQPTFRQIVQNDIPNPIPAGANLYLFYNY